MIIGRDFSESSRKFLRELARLSEFKTGVKIEVAEVNEQMQFGRNQIKNTLEYLEGRGYLKVETIGGPLLYGHISLTENGLEKVREK